MTTSVFIVEDEGLIALDLKRKLEQSGYSVPMIADNAEEAIEGVERFHPDLVLMDVRLRGKQDGIQTADQIRKMFQIPVMYVTAMRIAKRSNGPDSQSRSGLLSSHSRASIFTPRLKWRCGNTRWSRSCGSASRGYRRFAGMWPTR